MQREMKLASAYRGQPMNIKKINDYLRDAEYHAEKMRETLRRARDELRNVERDAANERDGKGSPFPTTYF